MNANIARLVVRSFTESFYDRGGVAETVEEEKALTEYLFGLIAEYSLDTPEWLTVDWITIRERNEARSEADREQRRTDNARERNS